MAVSYVRFLRGTPTAFDKVTTKDPDTLYFISETNATTGDLYLGSKLIAGKGTISTLSLGDLTNVITKTVTDSGSVLIYDEDQGKWVTKSPSEVSSLVYYLMKGATSEAAGASGFVPAPAAGQQNLYLRGDATWADPTATLNATIKTLVGDDGGLSIRQIAIDTLEEKLIPDDAKESLDTLKEIADWIQSHPDSASELNSRVTALEQTVYDVTDSEGNVTHVGLTTTVGNLSVEMANLKTSMNNLTTDVREVEGDITTIYDRLKWHEMDEEITSDS